MATPTNLPAAQTVGQNATSTWANDIRGAFRVLQVVSATSSTAWTNNTNTYTDITGVTVDITPQATSSKIFVVVSLAGAFKSTNNTSLDVEIRRQTTTIYTASSNFNTASAATNAGTIVLTYLDSPASTATRTYKVRGRSSANLAAVGTQALGTSDSTITVFEISA
jgi:hypothetical protein